MMKRTRAILLERVDLASKTVSKQTTVTLDFGQLVAFRRDATSNSVLLAVRKGEKYQSPSDPYPGYEVRLVDF